MAEQKIYESGRAPRHLATEIQLAEKKLVPVAPAVAQVETRGGRKLDLFDWWKTKHSRFVKAEDLKKKKSWKQSHGQPKG